MFKYNCYLYPLFLYNIIIIITLHTEFKEVCSRGDDVVNYQIQGTIQYIL